MSFLAATIFPAQSEIMLSTLILLKEHSIIALVLAASVGNVLGSLVNYAIGRYLIKYKGKKWFPIKETSIEKASKFYQKYGVWSLLLAWMPIIGDPLTLIAGIFRTNIYLFLILVTIGKAGRYVLLAAAIANY